MRQLLKRTVLSFIMGVYSTRRGPFYILLPLPKEVYNTAKSWLLHSESARRIELWIFIRQLLLMIIKRASTAFVIQWSTNDRGVHIASYRQCNIRSVETSI